jgi:hypothetical protein
MNALDRIREMEDFIRIIYMRDVYNVLRPTVAQQEDEHWWRDTFIQKAVNSNEFDFQDAWSHYNDRANENHTPEVFVVIEMINAIYSWSEQIYGETWSYDTLTYRKIFKMFPYMYVESKGVHFWREQKDWYNQYVAEMGPPTRQRPRHRIP